jgi:hypothetical protein
LTACPPSPYLALALIHTPILHRAQVARRLLVEAVAALSCELVQEGSPLGEGDVALALGVSAGGWGS